MTLRDYFAGQALGHCIPLIMNAAKQMSGAETMELIVAMSYEMADGMLRARGR